MKKISRKLLTLCLVCIMAIGMCVPAYADEVSPIASDSKSEFISSSGSTTWQQPDGYKAFRVSVRNQGSGPLTATIIYPNGNREGHTVQSGVNKVICVDNNVPSGSYELDFSSPSGVVSAEYEVKWSAESLSPLADGVLPFANDSKNGSVPSSGSNNWQQPDGYKAFRVSVWNQGSGPLTATIIYPTGNRERHTLQSGANKVISVDNNAPSGSYELDFSSPSGVVVGEYGVRWFAESL